MVEGGKMPERPVDPTVYSVLKENVIRCRICPTQCLIKPGKRGFCQSKLNKDGSLYTLNYGAVCYLGVDFIERTPLFHFWPGTQTLAVACSSCNFTCPWCVNWFMSQSTADTLPDIFYPSIEFILEKAAEWDCKSISYTYTEPTIWYDFALDIAKAAHKAGYLNVLNTNGYMSSEVLEKLAPHIDAANVDIKCFSDEFYRKYCSGSLKPVLETARRFKESGVHIEIANLIIAGHNDDPQLIRDLSRWIVDILGPDTPLIFEVFYPHYKYHLASPTSDSILNAARRVAMNEGLRYVYTWGLGPGQDVEGINTYCPNCGEELIHRRYFEPPSRASWKLERKHYKKEKSTKKW